MCLDNDNALIAELAILAYKASQDFLNYIQGQDLASLTYEAKDVILNNFLYPLLQRTADPLRHDQIRAEIERIQQSMGGS